MIADSGVHPGSGVDGEGTPDTIALGRLVVPAGTAAILFDMDGVLLDTLRMDYDVVNEILARHLDGAAPAASPELIRALFALSVDDFFRALLDRLRVPIGADDLAALVADYEAERRTALPAVHDGIEAILGAARRCGIRRAVVSNNAEAEVRIVLANTALLGHFDAVVGNDRPGLARKPAPDAYLEAAAVLGVDPSACVVVEDSLLGAEAGHRAGCHTVGVATGGASLDDLTASPYVDAWYESFAAPPGATDAGE